MTDTLPRAIPTDPAEQEAQMPEWVKVEVCRLWNSRQSAVKWTTDKLLRHNSSIFFHALTIWEWMPKPVDPDLQMAREAVADTIGGSGKLAELCHRGDFDDSHPMRAALAMAKRVREAKP